MGERNLPGRHNKHNRRGYKRIFFPPVLFSSSTLSAVGARRGVRWPKTNDARLHADEVAAPTPAAVPAPAVFVAAAVAAAPAAAPASVPLQGGHSALHLDRVWAPPRRRAAPALHGAAAGDSAHRNGFVHALWSAHQRRILDLLPPLSGRRNQRVRSPTGARAARPRSLALCRPLPSLRRALYPHLLGGGTSLPPRAREANG